MKEIGYKKFDNLGILYLYLYVLVGYVKKNLCLQFINGMQAKAKKAFLKNIF